MRRPFVFLLFIASIGLGIYLNSLGRYREVYRSICDLTAEHFYRVDDRLEQWVEECNFRAAHVSSRISSDQLLSEIQDMMNQLEVSHFSIYNPVEDRQMWKGESIDTGIRSRFVEDHLVVYRVIKGSSAEEAGVHPGDDIVKIAGAEQLTPWGAQHRAGEFLMRRAGQEVKVNVRPKTITLDLAPKITKLDSNTALVEIPSFRSEFFDREAWRRFAAQFTAYSHLIIDVRENAGGNFAAMLRALSTFQCGGKRVGVLHQPRKELPIKPAFEDVTADEYQIQELDKYRTLGLVTFPEYGCYRGKVTVLVSSDTSSVSEIFANSFFSRANSRVWGQPTAGDVVLAVWYDLPALGPGFSFSIPEAIFLTPDKKELENKGVWPQREIYYDLKTALAGKDTMIEAARR